MTTTAVRVPAGWYADPLSADDHGEPTHRRWWDGHGWTHHTALIGQTPASVRSAWSASAPESPDISPATVDALRLSALSPQQLRREAASIAETMPLHSASPVSAATPATGMTVVAQATTVTAADTVDSAEPQTGASTPESRAARAARTESRATSAAAHGRHKDVPAGPTRAHTLSLWLIATMPLTQVMILQWVIDLLPASSSPTLTIWLALALPFVLYAALASQDARQLSAAGHLRTVPWIVALVLPPVYIGARGIVVRRATGASPWPALLTWGALQAIVVITATLVDPGWLARLAELTAL